MTAHYRPERVGRATLTAMRIVADIREVGFRFCLGRGVPWVPQQQPPHGPQQQGEKRAEPADRLEDLAAWNSEVLIAVATHLGIQIPALPPP
ncbi:hypothetical protein E3N88_18826 [Mikania micrantha]|uniref:Uncharacterized protein n=1 Tax=Mikania micrantha TaxID=192012 RepID=A0A5N6NN59_9ASTR|nr:hypothetical protein E3N88_18826 [Mikania micrantha]